MPTVGRGDWRLADVRRILGFQSAYPRGGRRVQLATNYRCPSPVVSISRRLIEANHERFDNGLRKLRTARPCGQIPMCRH